HTETYHLSLHDALPIYHLDIKTAGTALNEAAKVLIMIHGRGGRAEDILGLTQHLNVGGYALLAPQATNHTWYPKSFIAPAEQNEDRKSTRLNSSHVKIS